MIVVKKTKSISYWTVASGLESSGRLTDKAIAVALHMILPIALRLRPDFECRTEIMAVMLAEVLSSAGVSLGSPRLCPPV